MSKCPMSPSRVLKKLGMLRDPQHERKIINDFNSPPFVLSYVEGVREVFQHPARSYSCRRQCSGNFVQ